jgi:sterol desaturase/sphingolipid hydroxylase (fatty acid hydroxylase superfamily)
MNDLISVLAQNLGIMAANTARALLTIAALFVPIWYLERRQGCDTSRYARRSFVHDFAYALFYDSGAFRVLGAALVFGALQNQLSFLRLGLAEGLPVVVVGLLYLLLNDFISYWLHRAEHTIPFLWQFHAVHHTPEELNFLTANRVHPFEKLMWGVPEIVLLIVLGVPVAWWLPFTLVRAFLAAVQHAELDWSYGPLYPVVVSPVFHRLHHSRDRRDFDSNYSQLFGIWDYAFGTANPSRTPPVAVGVEGLPPEPTILGQFWGPFRRLARPDGATEPPAPAPAPVQEDRPSESLAAHP